MYNLIKKLAILIFIILPCTTFAQPVTVDVTTAAGGQPVGGGGGRMEELVKYVRNLGLYFGFDLTKPPANAIITQLLDTSMEEAPRLNFSSLVNAYLGASIVTASGSEKDKGALVPSDNSFASINDHANMTFKSFQSPGQSGLTANPLIDQKEYQPDPVNQAILNILTTPDASWCKVKNPKDISKCNLLYRDKIISNVLGKIPQNFFDYAQNKQILTQLNSNSLTAPLLYADKASSGGSKKEGLTADTQAAQAANFVKYAISDVLPLPLLSLENYADLYLQYFKVVEDNSTNERDLRAKEILENYMASLRVYTAQRSVAISNLYDIMSRRVKQESTSEADKTPATSEALSEFVMAASRLKNIGDGKAEGPSQDWIKKINEASGETVQKEIALLLAEMNYQMYLSRQQQEKILLTNTMILIQNMRGNEPSLREIKERYSINQTSGQTQVGP